MKVRTNPVNSANISIPNDGKTYSGLPPMMKNAEMGIFFVFFCLFVCFVAESLHPYS